MIKSLDRWTLKAPNHKPQPKIVNLKQRNAKSQNEVDVIHSSFQYSRAATFQQIYKKKMKIKNHKIRYTDIFA